MPASDDEGGIIDESSAVDLEDSGINTPRLNRSMLKDTPPSAASGAPVSITTSDDGRTTNSDPISSVRAPPRGHSLEPNLFSRFKSRSKMKGSSVISDDDDDSREEDFEGFPEKFKLEIGRNKADRIAKATEQGWKVKTDPPKQGPRDGGITWAGKMNYF
jgi:hypothetical protein